MKTAILSIGDELVLGQTIDSNSGFISAKLTELGIHTTEHRTVSDCLELITNTITQLSNSADILIITGGLGPTEDDLTRQALAKAMETKLHIDKNSLGEIERYFKKRGRTMSEANKTQALIPQGAKPITNKRGTAPGISATINNTSVYVTPGVPHEMREMISKYVIVDINKKKQSQTKNNDQEIEQDTILTEKINTFGLGESSVAQKLGELMDRKQNPCVGTTVANGLVSIRVRSEFANYKNAKEHLDKTINEIYKRLGAIIFGRNEKTLGAAASEILKQRNLKIAVAESCTGGLLGTMLTQAPGTSATFNGGWVTYSNNMKINQLDIDKKIIEKYGAVSEQTAYQMAQNALIKSDSNIALSITGIAGPGGGTVEKPVGTIFIALSSKKNNSSIANISNSADITIHVMQLQLSGDRETVRDRAAKSALQMLRLYLLGKPLDLIDHGRLVNIA